MKCPKCKGPMRCMSCIGKKGGRSKSPAKLRAARRTLRIAHATTRGKGK